METAKRLQELIDDLNATPSAFARSIGVSSDTVYNILNEKTKLSAATIKAILDTYRNVNRDWLRDGTGEKYLWQTDLHSSVEKPKCKGCQERDYIITELHYIITEQRIVIDNMLKEKNI